MKEICTILLSYIFVSVNAQQLNYNEVYDFGIGDEFEYIYDYSAPPGGYKIIYLDKWFNDLGDSIFYKFKRISYGSEVVYSPSPHLEYSFKEEIDTAIYKIGSETIEDIFSKRYDPNDTCSSESFDYYFNDSWQAEAVKHTTSEYTCFESNTTTIFYAVGFGYTNTRTTVTSGGYQDYGVDMVYAKKGEKEFGTKDDTYEIATGIFNLQSTDIHLYPNPSSDILNISLPLSLPNVNIKIFDITGKQILTKSFENQRIKIDISNFRKGIYSLRINYGNQYLNKRFVKK